MKNLGSFRIKSVLYILSVWFLIGQVISCAPKDAIDMESPIQSHGRLDPAAQDILENPQQNRQIIMQELRQTIEARQRLERQIDPNQLGGR